MEVLQEVVEMEEQAVEVVEELEVEVEMVVDQEVLVVVMEEEEVVEVVEEEINKKLTHCTEHQPLIRTWEVKIDWDQVTVMEIGNFQAESRKFIELF